MSLPPDLLPLLGAPALIRATYALWSAQRGNVELWKHVEHPPSELFEHCPALERHHPKPHAYTVKLARLFAKGRFVLNGERMLRTDLLTGDTCVMSGFFNMVMSTDGKVVVTWVWGSITVTRGGLRETIRPDDDAVGAALYDNGELVYATRTGVFAEDHRLVHRGTAYIMAAGTTLLINTEHGEIHLMQQRTHAKVTVQCPHGLRYALSPNGLRAVALSDAADLVVLDTMTGALMWSARHGAIYAAVDVRISNAEDVVLSQDGCAFLATREGVRWLMDVRGYDPCFDDDGRLWFLSEGRVHSLLL